MENIVKVFCGVRYQNKDEAKKLGAKWDSEKKAWFFEINISEIEENKNIHTYSFKPFSLQFINCEKTFLTNKYYTLLFNLLNERNNKYILDNTEKTKNLHK